VNTQESNIVEIVLIKTLSEREKKELRLLLPSEENYQKFLITLFEILIGKEKTISLESFLDLHSLEGKLAAIKEYSNEIIEDLAELAYNGHSSNYTIWLSETKNEVYLYHLRFAEDIKKVIQLKERITIRERLNKLEKMKGFELTDAQIERGVIYHERNRLRKRFAELDAKTAKQENKGFFQLKFATIVLLITISGAILAFSIPGFRNFIKKEFKELFQKEVLPIKKENDAVIAPKAITSDTLVKVDDAVINKPTTNQIEQVPVTEVKKESKTVVAPTKTAILLEAFVSNKDANSEVYWNYFRRQKLDNIEGLWKWTCIKRTHINLVLADTLPLFCAIREIEDKKYEIAFFKENGNRVHPSYVSIITKKINNNKYELTQYKNEKHPIVKYIYLSDEGELKFNAYFILSDFQNFAGKVNKGEWSEYTVTGKKNK
jgi:hypothetical protein